MRSGAGVDKQTDAAMSPASIELSGKVIQSIGDGNKAIFLSSC